MSAPSGDRFTIALLFGLIGLPPGLCSLAETPSLLSLSHDRSPEASFYAAVFAVFWLIGIGIFGAMLRLLIRTWQKTP